MPTLNQAESQNALPSLAQPHFPKRNLSGQHDHLQTAPSIAIRAIFSALPVRNQTLDHNMKPPSTQQIQAADKLLSLPKNSPEDNIRQNISRLLDTFAIENIITYTTPDGPADLYLPRRRTFIETKAHGLADDPHQPQQRENNETPFQQLQRYLISEIRYELSLLDFEVYKNRPWLGIVTDGRVWHAWRFPHHHDPYPEEIFTHFHPATGQELAIRLRHRLADDPIGKPWIPHAPADLFKPRLPPLDQLLADLTGTNLQHATTKRMLWLDMLKSSGIAPDNEYQQHRLFVAHSFLVAIARGVIHTLSHPDTDPDPATILTDGFSSWILHSPTGQQWAQELLQEIHSYEWRRRPGDVLRSVYEAFIAPSDRKVFGEYYTPDWLAELLCEEILDDKWLEQAVADSMAAHQQPTSLTGRGVLDPACGSGTFLFHAARRILHSPALRDEPVTPQRKAAIVARLIHGLDVHPVAVEIARATVLRALPAPPPDAADNIQIYQGDSLQAHHGGRDSLFSADANGALRFTSPRNTEAFLPHSFTLKDDFLLNLRSLVQAATDQRPLSSFLLNSVSAGDRDTLREFHSQLQQIIQDEGNSVWTWYVANITAPLRFSEKKVDRILANPPWVRLGDIQVPDRKKDFETFFKDIKLWQGGRNAPNQDIAQLFPKRCRELYLAKPDSNPAAWIVKRSYLTASHWTLFRDSTHKTVRQVLDLDKMQPFGPGDAVRCVALLDHRVCSRLFKTKGKHIILSSARRIQPHHSIREAKQHIDVMPAPPPIPRAPSAYSENSFRRGATIFPDTLTIIAHTKDDSFGTTATITTTPSRHSPWNAVPPQSGTIPSLWVRTVLRSSDLLVFGFTRSPSKGIIPVDADGSLHTSPIECNDFWKRIDSLYRDFRGKGSNTPATLLDNINDRKRLDFQLALLQQLPTTPAKSVVVYPKSADIMRSARLAPSVQIFADTLYYFTATSETEAAYLAAILNAPSLTLAFAEARTSGRHFDLSPWRNVPIPKFHPSDPLHQALVEQTIAAETETAAWLADSGNTANRGQPALCKRIRAYLTEKNILPKTDSLVRQLLPNQATAP